MAPLPRTAGAQPWALLALILLASPSRPDDPPAAEAPDPARWAFRPLSRPPLPAVLRESWCRNPIDRFVLARLEREGLSPSPEASRRALVRRMTLDVTGLPPTPEEVEAFVADEREDAVERLAERLLDSPRYGERWARHWLDVVRFAETNGFETNTPRENAWPYRDYVIRALNEDRPYPRFILEQLAGDAVGEDAATGFLVAGPQDTVKSPDPKLTAEQRANELHDMVSVTGAAFLGLTVGCARCHDHKFDPIPQREYYALQAVFAGVLHGERELSWPDQEERDREAARLRSEIAAIDSKLWDAEPPASWPPASAIPGEAPARARPAVSAARNVDRFPPVRARLVRLTVLSTNSLEPCIDEIELYSPGPEPRNLALASGGAGASASSEYPGAAIHKIAHLNDGRHGNGRSWISNEPGQGWAQIELREPALIDRVIWGRDREGKYTDRLAVEYRIEVAEEPGAWRAVASSADRRTLAGGAGAEPAPDAHENDGNYERILLQRRGLEGRLAEVSRKRMIYAGVFQEPGPTRLFHRGDPLEPREEVRPGAIGAAGNPLDLPAGLPERERRLALARWIGDPRNPLTARVLVNRIWHHHFGLGLVATPSDFGKSGARPTHPELLDWLASELIDRGWSRKAIHRFVLGSSVYRQASAPEPRGLAADAGSALLWRFPPRRLEAEALRDSILHASGKLDLAPGGPGYDAFEPNDNYVRVYVPRTKFGPAEWRRMIYQKKPRKEQDSTFGAFDCPDASQPTPRRLTSTNPLQALNLLNSTFVMEQAAFLAERLGMEAGGDPGSQARRAFLIAFGREPDAEESDASVRLIREHGLAVFCRAIFNTNELAYIP